MIKIVSVKTVVGGIIVVLSTGVTLYYTNDEFRDYVDSWFPNKKKSQKTRLKNKPTQKRKLKQRPRGKPQ